MTGVPLGDQTIRRYLREVADEMSPTGSQHTILVVGGALLAWHGLRDATQDVDSVRHLDEELQEAVRTVADAHGLAPAWLNHSSSGFRPQTLDEADCDVVMDLPRLRVLGAPLRQVFVMKMFAAREPDRDDLIALWPHLSLTPEEAVAEFWHAYPAAPDDPYLVNWIRQIAAESEPT